MKKALTTQGFNLKLSGRGERIRTSDSYVPNVVLYQAELRPDRFTEQTLEGSRNSEEA